MADDPGPTAECVARAQAGDAAAASELVAASQALVWQIVRAYRACDASDDDLAQEVYLTMFARLDRYVARDGIPFQHWLARLAVNACRDVLRSESRRPRPQALPPDHLDWLAHGSGPAVGDAHAARDLVDRLLAELPPADRLVLVMLDLEQRPVAEIATLTGWSQTLVKVRAFRARRRLRAVAESWERRAT